MFDRLGGIASEQFDIINHDGLQFVYTVLGSDPVVGMTVNRPSGQNGT